MRLKLTKLVTMTFFSIFSCFSLSLGQEPKKSCNPKSSGNLQAGKFLKYFKKKRNSLAIKGAEKKSRWLR
jgi:hypothetical protein